LKPQPNSDIVLGIDPGLATTGWGVIAKSAQDITLRAYGAIETKPADPLPERLLQIRTELLKLIDLHHPTIVAIEELFFAKFATSIAATAQARGSILATAAERQLPVAEYNPRAIKVAVTGFGSASKEQVQSMVQRCLGLPQPPRPDDAADALAIALCHTQTHREQRLSGQAIKRSSKALESLIARSLARSIAQT
jgi:crossover junction endodeoxyribonuclease RuvC